MKEPAENPLSLLGKKKIKIGEETKGWNSD